MEGSGYSLFSPFYKSFLNKNFQFFHANGRYKRSFHKDQFLAELQSQETTSKLKEALETKAHNHKQENLLFTVGKKARKARVIVSDKGLRKQSLETYSTIPNTRDITPATGTKEIRKKKNKRSFEELVRSSHLKAYFEHDLLTWSDSQLINLALESKESALALQLCIDDCSEEFLARLGKIATSNIEALIIHQTGNFVLQKIMKKNSQFSCFVSDYCFKLFKSLSENEYSSRVMQCLIESDPSFRKRVLTLFREDLNSYIQTFSSAFLVSVAVRMADTEYERDILKSSLKLHPKRWLAKKYFKRVLVAYIISCASEELDSLYDLLSGLFKPYDFFRDRYSCLILLAFVERRHPASHNLVLGCIQDRPFDLFRWSVFIYFLEHLSHGSNSIELMESIHQTLINLSHIAIGSISANVKTYRNYVLSLAMTQKSTVSSYKHVTNN